MLRRNTGTEAGATGFFTRSDARASILAALLALLAAAPAQAAPPPASPQVSEIHIAFIGTLSGAHANMAQDELDGFLLGVKDLGGRLGGIEFNLSTADDGGESATAVKSFQHLAESERYRFLLLSTDPQNVAAVVPAAVASRTFVINLSPPAAGLAGRQCSPYLFSLASPVETLHELAGQYLQNQGYRTVAVVGPGGAAEDDALAALRRSYKGSLVEVTSRRGEMDFSQALHGIRAAAPDAVYLLDSGGLAVNFMLQYEAKGLKKMAPLVGPATAIDQSVLATMGPPAADIFSVGPWSDDLDAPANRRLMGEFEGEYGRPASFYATQGYDAAMLIDAAIKALDRRIGDEDALRGALRRSEFPSTRGSFRFDTNQFPIQSYFLRQVVKDSREHMVNELRGTLARDYRDGRAGECSMRWVAEASGKPLAHEAGEGGARH
jgi:branched-chain amino acid transport system substrate-binding protein